MEAYTQTHTLSRGAPSSMRLSYFLPLQLNAPTPFDEQWPTVSTAAAHAPACPHSYIQTI